MHFTRQTGCECISCTRDINMWTVQFLMHLLWLFTSDELCPLSVHFAVYFTHIFIQVVFVLQCLAVLSVGWLCVHCVFYSFTWMSSRLDKNLITVVTGQAVDAFDKLFRTLYGTSSSVDLRQVAKEPEPEPEPLPQPASVAPPSAAVARKLYNPKYALALGNPSPTPSAGDNSPKKTPSPENSRSPDVPDNKKGRRRRRRASKEAVQEPPPIHPGLIDLEKASLISYLPTWPEPDPSKDVIGFINIRDANRPTQVHLQRSEMFGTSQAIKFSSPFSKPEETLPEVARPRQLTAKPGEINKVQLPQDKTKAQPTHLRAQTGFIKSKAEASEQNAPASRPKWDTAKTLNNEGKLHSNTPPDQDAGQNTTPHLNAHTPPKFSGKASPPITGTPSQTTNDPEPDSLPGSNAKTNQTHAVVYRRDTTLSSHLRDSNTVEHTQTKAHTDSPTAAAAHAQPQNSAEITPNVQSPTVSPSSTSAYLSQSVTSASLSVNSPVSITTSTTTSAGAPSSSISPPPTSTPLTSPLPSSSPAPPVPKPRTIQLLIKESGSGEKLPELSVIRALETSTGPQAVRDEPAVEKKKGPDTVPELQNDSGSGAGAQKDAENAGHIRDAPQHKQGGTAQDDTKNNKAVRRLDDRAGMQSLAGTNRETQSDVLISGVPKAECVNIREIIPKDVVPETLTSLTDCKVTPQKDCEEAGAGATGTERALTGCKFAEVPNETSKNVTQRKTLCTSAPELQTISYGGLTPEAKGVLDILDSLKAQKHTPRPAAHNQHASKGSAGDSAQTSPADAHVEQGSLTNTVKHNLQSPSQELITKSRGSTRTPEKSLRLYLSDVHPPDLPSQTPEREASLLAAVARTPTLDGTLPSSPSPDSRTHTPDPRSFTPDIRTPTPDGYVTPRPDSALSAASDEYYECSSSPLHETVGDRAAHRNHSAAEDRVSSTHTNSPNATTVATGPACINHSATLESTDRNSSNSGSQSLSGPASVSSVSSLHEERVTVRKEGKTNEENAREVDPKGSVTERRTEGDCQETQRRGRDEAKRPADHFKQGKDLTETVGKNEEAQPQVLKRKNAPNQVTQRQPSTEGAERKRLSAGDLTGKRLSAEGEGPDKETAVDRAATRPSCAARKSSPKSSGETEGQKVWTARQQPSSARLSVSTSLPPFLASSPRLLPPCLCPSHMRCERRRQGTDTRTEESKQRALNKIRRSIHTTHYISQIKTAENMSA